MERKKQQQRKDKRQSCFEEMGIDMEDRKGFYKSFFQICVALILQNVMTLAVNLADNMMIGGYSEISLSGVAAAATVDK